MTITSSDIGRRHAAIRECRGIHHRDTESPEVDKEEGVRIRIRNPFHSVLCALSASVVKTSYSTVTLFARLRGWSTSVPRATAML